MKRLILLALGFTLMIVTARDTTHAHPAPPPDVVLPAMALQASQPYTMQRFIIGGGLSNPSVNAFVSVSLAANEFVIASSDDGSLSSGSVYWGTVRRVVAEGGRVYLPVVLKGP